MSALNDEIHIGEGVAIDSSAAPVTMRLVSGLIDGIIYLTVLAVGSVAIANVTSQLNQALTTAAGISWIVICLVAIPAAVETLTRGLSVGKLAMGLRVVRDDGGPITLRHSLARSMTGVLEIYMTVGLIATTTSMLSARGKRIGDVLAGTFAMRTRGVRKSLPPIVMPASLSGWASTADIRRLPDGLALTARLFLARAPHLHPEARTRLGTGLMGQLRAYVSPEPPYGTHPEETIAAILATRRDREYHLAMARRSRRTVEEGELTRLPYGVVDATN